MKQFVPVTDGLANLVMRPWFDRVALHGIAHWLFPLSRAWAEAADASEPGELAAAIGGVRLPLRQLERAWRATRRQRQRYQEAAAVWESAFFGPGNPAAETLVEAERCRADAAQAFMAARANFVPFHLVRRLPPIRWSVARPATVEARHGRRLAEPSSAFPARSPDSIEVSRTAPSGDAEIGWIRFETQVGGAPDTAWARVITPRGVKDPPTLVFLHGIAMEPEFLPGDHGIAESMVALGCRVIRAEGPTHGRRRHDRYFGGEPIMAAGPLGMLDLFEAWVGEAAALVAWARRTSCGSVALGGLSLGALTAQLAGCAAASWPEEARPDALLLVATSGDVIEVGSGGSLGRALGVPAQLAASGWTPEALACWRPLLEPSVSAVDPARIVMVLGAADDLTPYRGGDALATRWKVPRENVFARAQGHFSVALDLPRRSAPLRRVVEIVRG
jgi:hypothetical protein